MNAVPTLEWLAAGTVALGEEIIAFIHKPQMAVLRDVVVDHVASVDKNGAVTISEVTSDVVLVAGARDFGLVAVNKSTGEVFAVQHKHRGKALGVLVDGMCIYLITPTHMHTYVLTQKQFTRVGAPSTLSCARGQFTGVATIDRTAKVIHVRYTNESIYKIYTVYYGDGTYERLLRGDENDKAITHLYHYQGANYGVVGSLGTVYALSDLSNPAPMLFHTNVCSATAGPNWLVSTTFGGTPWLSTSTEEGLGLAVWSEDGSDNAIVELSLRSIFPTGDNVVVLAHDNELITLHPSLSLMHVLEVVSTERAPSANLIKVKSDEQLALIGKQILRPLNCKAKTLTPNAIIGALVGVHETTEDAITVEDERPTQLPRTPNFDLKSMPSLSPSFFTFGDAFLADFSQPLEP